VLDAYSVTYNTAASPDANDLRVHSWAYGQNCKDSQPNVLLHEPLQLVSSDHVLKKLEMIGVGWSTNDKGEWVWVRNCGQLVVQHQLGYVFTE